MLEDVLADKNREALEDVVAFVVGIPNQWRKVPLSWASSVRDHVHAVEVFKGACR